MSWYIQEFCIMKLDRHAQVMVRLRGQSHGFGGAHQSIVNLTSDSPSSRQASVCNRLKSSPAAGRVRRRISSLTLGTVTLSTRASICTTCCVVSSLRWYCTSRQRYFQKPFPRVAKITEKRVKFSDFVSVEAIRPSVSADSKEGVIREMTQSLVDAEQGRYDQA